MEEELDYMSDDFIKNYTNPINDVRPGLLKSHKEQREHHLLKKKKLTTESQKKINEEEIRQKSLKQPIDSSNKGFSMLQKMGFKTGMGLGKSNTGIVEPIGIKIKNNKEGLGHKIVVKNEKRMEALNEENYRAFQSKKNQKRELLHDLGKSQRMCQKLDLQYDKFEPEKSWFWPDDGTTEEVGKCDSENDDMKLNVSDKLETLTRYLRSKYYYCIWCKVQYSDETDIKNCPGNTRYDH